MFREMRRNKQALSREECDAVLRRGSCGVLALAGDGDYPYAVPISYVYCGDRLLFHCAKAGHKLDAISRNEKASFCVVDQDQVSPEEFTTYFRSVIVFGRMRVLERAEVRAAAEQLADKYCAVCGPEGIRGEIDRFYDALCMLELSVEHMSGKEAIEIVRAREKAAPQE